MDHALYGPLALLERAKSHTIEADSMERDFFQHHRATIQTEFDPNCGKEIAKVVLRARPPILLSILLAEAAYHIRSALNQTLVAAGFNAGMTRRQIDHRQWPSGQDAASFQAACSQCTVGMPRQFVDIVEKSKCHYDGDASLRAIFAINNIDKHWSIAPHGSFGAPNGLFGYTFFKANIEIGRSGDLNEGIHIGQISLGGHVRPNRPDAHVPVAAQIVFSGQPAYAGKPAIATTTAAIESAQSLVKEAAAKW